MTQKVQRLLLFVTTIWNALPDNIRTVADPDRFRKLLNITILALLLSDLQCGVTVERSLAIQKVASSNLCWSASR